MPKPPVTRDPQEIAKINEEKERRERLRRSNVVPHETSKITGDQNNSATFFRGIGLGIGGGVVGRTVLTHTGTQASGKGTRGMFEENRDVLQRSRGQAKVELGQASKKSGAGMALFGGPIGIIAGIAQMIRGGKAETEGLKQQANIDAAVGNQQQNEIERKMKQDRRSQLLKGSELNRQGSLLGG